MNTKIEPLVVPATPLDPPPLRDAWGTIQAGAEYLDVDPRVIRKAVAAGSIRAQRIGKRMIRIWLPDLDTLGRPLQYTGGDAA